MSLANRAYSAGRSITARVRCVGEMSSEPMITLSTDASRSRKIRALTFSPQRINSTHMTGTVPLRNNFERRTALLPHKRLTPSTAALSRPTDTENFDLTELGAQFAILDCHYKQWMDEYLNEPTFDEPSSSIRP
ncbi:uncharacterized protein EKO05_0011132 [Ascochyta rabiei]|uniref:uncharacterized protein n=1 Tax=Didymella rabiei TaxID=5454 RepID=UPI0022048312|nr:uncharacterized protein EKO05_0011132 [Ascochyta rabiei]UPX20921.1 hypothetical protein EKO05_0011132 [Ascochyta rabiei]